MKKLVPLLTGAIMLLSLAACGSRTAAPEATTAPAAAGGKTLVVYFSATGSTKTAASTKSKIRLFIISSLFMFTLRFLAPAAFGRGRFCLGSAGRPQSGIPSAKIAKANLFAIVPVPSPAPCGRKERIGFDF